MDTPIKKTPTKSIKDELDEAVEEALQSKRLAVTGVVGKASLFDLSTHSPDIDYTVGGKLSPRWCNDNDANIAARKLQGYVFPEDISPRLKNIRRGGQVLMLRHREAVEQHRAALEQENRSWEGKAFNKSDKAKAPGLEGFKIERPERR